MEGRKSKKLVLFFEKKQRIGGSSIFLIEIAKKIAELGVYDEVWYVNHKNQELEARCEGSAVHCCDVADEVFEDFAGADFVVPANYLLVFLTRMQGIQTGHLLLFDWHPEMIAFLENQFPRKWQACEKLIPFFQQTKALAFMDKSCKITADRLASEPFPNKYIPVFSSDPPQSFCQLKEPSSGRVSIGWLGRLDSDKTYALVNLLDNLKRLPGDIPIDVHIIGDGNCRNLIRISDYTPRIRFIFTSFLMGSVRDVYIQENIDLMVTMGIAALDCANLSLPVVIAPAASKQFKNNQYVYLYDTDSYSLGWHPQEIEQLNLTTHSIEEIIEDIYAENGKKEIGRRCYYFCHDTFDVDKSAEKLLRCIEKSELSAQGCFDFPIIRKQLRALKCYQRLRWPAKRDYFAYSAFMGKVNAFLGKTPAQRIRYAIKVGPHYLFTPLRSLFRLAAKDFYLVGTIWRKAENRVRKKVKWSQWCRQAAQLQDLFPAKIEAIKERYQREKIPVAFIVIYSTTFPSEPVFEKMLHSERFDPYIIVSPDMQRSLEHKINTYRKSYADLTAMYGDRVLHGFDEEQQSYLELGENYPVVFFNNPYEKMAHPYHYERYFRDKNVLTIYINYGFFSLKFGRNIVKMDIYSAIWKVCIDSPENYTDLVKQQAIKGRNALITGYIKMDRLADFSTVPHERKMIIIAPHHTVMGWKELDISNFLMYSDFFAELPSHYPEIDFVFRPHPLFFNNLLEKHIWTREQIDTYIVRIKESPNCRYDDSGDYLQLFADSDAMIHDCGSYIGEYLFTEKPCCYMLKADKQVRKVLLPMGEACMAHYYKAFCEADICNFIENVVLKGNDPLKEKRQQFSRTHLKFNYPHGAQTIISLLEETICTDGENGGTI